VTAASASGVSTVALPGSGFLGDVSANAAEAALKFGIRWFAESLGGAVRSLMVDMFNASTRPPVTAPGFLGPNGAYHAMASVSSLLLVGAIIIGVIEAVFSGEPGQAFTRMARHVPLAVLAIAGFPWLTDQLLTVTDVMSSAVLPASEGTRMADLMAIAPSHDIPGLLISALAFFACVLLYMELVVRDALTLILVALAPVSFAASAIPAARAAAGKVVQLVVAIAFSKPAIFVALRIGIDRLYESRHGAPTATSWGQYISGVAVLAVAVFMPFVVWRLLPLVEGYALAQGVARAPFRAAMQTVQTVYWTRALRGGNRGVGGGPARLPGGDLPGGGLGKPRRLTDPPGDRGRQRRATGVGDGPGEGG
jgi:hypothetical protein